MTTLIGEDSQPTVVTTEAITTVHIVFKTHLDVGFTDLARAVTYRYVESYIPRAVALARELRAAGGDERFVWTTGSWLIHEYLEQASPSAGADLEQAIQAGDVAWHGLPFTTHSELLDPSLFAFGLSLSQDLDRRFGKQTIAAKMTDVPGHTRGIVPLLAQAGIRFLHIGVNPACTAPAVPPVFVWEDPSGAELLVMYHQGSYGDLMVVPGLDEVIVFAHTGDNLGPPSAAEVREVFQHVRARFPKARILASTMDRFAEALVRIARDLPRVRAEIGDTWIHGVGTDPGKVARFRELCRLRRHWLDSGTVALDDPQLARCSRALLLIAEHTWGLDVKTHLGNWTGRFGGGVPLDNAEYAPDTFHAARVKPAFQALETSWAEQRSYIDEAVAALDGSPLATVARVALDRIQPARLVLDETWTALDPADPIETPHFILRVDPATGAISFLQEKRTERIWASDTHFLASYWYQTFGQEDYDRFWQQYAINKYATREWSWFDLTKPGMAMANAREGRWYPRLDRLYSRDDAVGRHTRTLLTMDEEACIRYGAPRTLTLEMTLPEAEPVIQLTLQWFDKSPCRLPEAQWLSFQPIAPDPAGWRLDKMGESISPLEVIRNGNRKLHAVDQGLTYRDRTGSLRIETLDAPLVAPGQPSLLDFNNRQPPLREGMHVNLHNNVWGTNFPMWYGDDARFHFTLAFDVT